jgi:hypothetical protein
MVCRNVLRVLVPLIFTPLAGAEGIVGGVDISVEHQRQQFENSSAEIETVTLLPYLQFGDWELALDLPWQQIEGEYFVNGRYPALASFCEGVSALTPLQQLQSIRNGALTARQIYFCNNNPDLAGSRVESSVSGFGDATLSLGYAVPLDAAAHWFGSATLGYKHDNGDFDAGLGSASRDLLGELALLMNRGRFNAVVSAGYVTILADESGFDYDDYAYGAVDLGVQLLRELTIGGRYDFQQSSVDGFDDIESATAYLRWRPFEMLNLRVYNTEYLDVDGYPEREYGGAVSLQF